MSATCDEDTMTGRDRLRRNRWRLLRWAVLVLVLAGSGLFLGPKTADALKPTHHLGHVQARWLVVAVIAEIGSLIAFSLVTWSLITRAERPKWRRVLRLDLVTIGLSHAVPVGWAAGTALGYELLREEGVDGVQSGFVKVSQSLLSSLLLELVFSVALLLQTIVYGPSATNLGLAAAGAVLAGLIIAFCYLLAHRPSFVTAIATRTVGRLPRVDPARLVGIVDSLSQRMTILLRRKALLARVCLWSLLNWAFDLLALWAALRAFGSPPHLVLLVIAFCVGQVAASIPISPGGLGVVETSLVPLLAGFGTASSVAVLGVLCWRLVNFWLPLPVGAGAYLLIVLERRRGRRERDRLDVESAAAR
jgi:uncharacterized protein (TIRG00374 family)